jgi:hypothetical protein
MDGALWRWDLTTPGRPVDLPVRPSGSPLLKLAVVPGSEGAAIVAGWTADGVLGWWDPTEGTEQQSMRPDGITEPIHDLLTVADAVVLAHAAGLAAYPTATRSDTTPPQRAAKDPATPQPELAAGKAFLRALAHPRDHASVAIGTGRGAVNVDLTTGRATGIDLPEPSPISLASAADGRLLAVLGDGSIRGEGLLLGRNGRRVVSEDSLAGSVGAWLETDNAELVELAGSPPERAQVLSGVGTDIRSLAAARIGRRWVAAGDAAGAARLIGLGSAPLHDVVRIGGGPVTALVFAHSGRWLIAGSASGLVHRINLAGSRPVAVIGQHAGAVTGLAVVSDTDAPRASRDARDVHDRVVSCSADGTLRLWDVEAGRLLGVAAGPAGMQAITADERTITARDDEGRLWVLEADPFVPAAQPRKMVTGSGWRTGSRDVGPREVEVRVELTLRVSSPVELRAARVVTEPPLRPTPGQRPGILVDDQPVVVDEGGRLSVPRRFVPASPWNIDVRQGLRTTARRATPPLPSLRLTVYSPDFGEVEVVLAGTGLPEPE